MGWQGRLNKITSRQPRKSETHFIPHTHLYHKEPLGFQSHYALVAALAHFIYSELFRKSLNAGVIVGGSRMKSELEEYIFITLPQSPLVVACLRISSHLPFHHISFILSACPVTGQSRPAAPAGWRPLRKRWSDSPRGSAFQQGP